MSSPREPASPAADAAGDELPTCSPLSNVSRWRVRRVVSPCATTCSQSVAHLQPVGGAPAASQRRTCTGSQSVAHLQPAREQLAVVDHAMAFPVRARSLPRLGHVVAAAAAAAVRRRDDGGGDAAGSRRPLVATPGPRPRRRQAPPGPGRLRNAAGDATRAELHDKVGGGDGDGRVGREHDGRVVKERAEEKVPEDRERVVCVERREHVVEQVHVGGDVERACEGDTRALAARDGVAARRWHAGVAVGKALHVYVELARLEHLQARPRVMACTDAGLRVHVLLGHGAL